MSSRLYVIALRERYVRKENYNCSISGVGPSVANFVSMGARLMLILNSGFEISEKLSSS